MGNGSSDIMYISVFCGRKIMDELKGASITTKQLRDLLTKPKDGSAQETIKDYPFYIFPQLIVTQDAIETSLKEKKYRENGMVEVKIPFYTFHDAVIDEVKAQIRDDIPDADVQVMPYDKVVLMYRKTGNKTESKEVEISYSVPVSGDSTRFIVTFIDHENTIMNALNHGELYAKYRIPAQYYRRNLSAASVEILGKIYDSIEEKLKENKQLKTSSNDFYASLGIPAILEGVPLKLGIADKQNTGDAKIDRWILKEHLQNICEQIAIKANTYKYGEFEGATSDEIKLPDISTYLEYCFPEKKIVNVKFNPTPPTFSFDSPDSNLVADAKEQLKLLLEKNELRVNLIGDNSVKVQPSVNDVSKTTKNDVSKTTKDDNSVMVTLVADNVNKITKIAENLSYTFHHITRENVNTAINIRKIKMDYRFLSCERIVGPVIVSSVKPHVTRDEIVRFKDSINVRGAIEFEGGDAEISRNKKENKFLWTGGNKPCLNQGVTTFRIKGHAQLATVGKATMQITCEVSDSDTNYVFSRELTKDIKDTNIKPDEKLLGIANGDNGYHKVVDFQAERTEVGYNHGKHEYEPLGGKKEFSMLQINNNFDKFFSRANVMGEWHHYWRVKRENVKLGGFLKRLSRTLFDWYWDPDDEDETLDNIKLEVEPQLTLRIETIPQKFEFRRPISDFKIEFIHKDGHFSRVPK
jgi:hypothetical protein